VSDVVESDTGYGVGREVRTGLPPIPRETNRALSSRSLIVSFSCGEYSGLQHCAQCGRHAWCRGNDKDHLICELCFRLNENSFSTGSCHA
jgi:hypothetical protein